MVFWEILNSRALLQRTRGSAPSTSVNKSQNDTPTMVEAPRRHMACWKKQEMRQWMKVISTGSG